VSSYGGHFAQAARKSIVLKYLSPRSQIIVTTIIINLNPTNQHPYLIKMLIVLLTNRKDYGLICRRGEKRGQESFL
jgi:hypothetical protein